MVYDILILTYENSKKSNSDRFEWKSDVIPTNFAHKVSLKSASLKKIYSLTLM